MKRTIKKIFLILIGTIGLFFTYCACESVNNFTGTICFLVVAFALVCCLSTDTMTLPSDYEDGDEILFRKRRFTPPPPPEQGINEGIYPINHEKLLG